MTRPTMRVSIFGAPPQIALPTSKINTETMYSHFALNIPYDLPLGLVSASEVWSGGRRYIPCEDRWTTAQYEANTKPTELVNFSEPFDDRSLDVGGLDEGGQCLWSSKQLPFKNLQLCCRGQRETL